MTIRAFTRVTLELDVAADPISGRLTDEHGETRAFTGLMAMVHELERCRGTVPDAHFRSGTPAAAPD